MIFHSYVSLPEGIFFSVSKISHDYSINHHENLRVRAIHASLSRNGNPKPKNPKRSSEGPIGQSYGTVFLFAIGSMSWYGGMMIQASIPEIETSRHELFLNSVWKKGIRVAMFNSGSYCGRNPAPVGRWSKYHYSTVYCSPISTVGNYETL